MSQLLSIDAAVLLSQLLTVAMAFLLCFLLGIERHYHLKDAGIKTHVLVGVGACLFTLVSAYGFQDIATDITRFDPSRIAAQIVSGIGFLGAGVIFVNNDTVRGLTTAATIWLSAAVGMACGAHMIALAVCVLAMHYLLVFVINPLVNKLPHRHHGENILVEYDMGYGVMSTIIVQAQKLGLTTTIERITTRRTDQGNVVTSVISFSGQTTGTSMLHTVASMEGVRTVEKLNAHPFE